MENIKLNKYAPHDSSLLDKLLFQQNIYFNNYRLKNDLIKINEDKICFTTSSSDNETLYISVIDIVKSQRVYIRYYSIDIFKLYNRKILLDMRSHLFNKFITLGFSYCPQDSCESDKIGDHFSAFLIFSYPNGTDSTLNINKYLFENNDIKITDIVIDLKKYAKIENNLFGYIYYGFNIKENNCENIDLLSYDTDELISIGEPLIYQKIKLRFKDNLYEEINCRIKYKNIYADPNFSDYNHYIDKTDQNEFDESTQHIIIKQNNMKENQFIIIYLLKKV